MNITSILKEEEKVNEWLDDKFSMCTIRLLKNSSFICVFYILCTSIHEHSQVCDIMIHKSDLKFTNSFYNNDELEPEWMGGGK